MRTFEHIWLSGENYEGDNRADCRFRSRLFYPTIFYGIQFKAKFRALKLTECAGVLEAATLPNIIIPRVPAAIECATTTTQRGSLWLENAEKPDGSWSLMRGDQRLTIAFDESQIEKCLLDCNRDYSSICLELFAKTQWLEAGKR